MRRDGGFKGVFIVIIKIIFTEQSEAAFKLRWSDDAEFFVNGGERAFKMELITSEGQLGEETEFFSVTGLRGEDLAIFTEKFKSMIWILKMPAGSLQLKGEDFKKFIGGVVFTLKVPHTATDETWLSTEDALLHEVLITGKDDDDFAWMFAHKQVERG